MKAKYITLAIAAAVGFSSCNDLLNIEQHGVLDNSTYYQTDEEAVSGLVQIYNSVKGQEYNYGLGKSVLTDDFWSAGGQRNDNAELEQLNEFNYSIENSVLSGMFSGWYTVIHDANMVIDNVNDDSDVKLQAKAEAKVFRAWAYFELVTLWGNPPLVLHEIQDLADAKRANSDPAEIWAQIETDLTEAIESGKLHQKANSDDKTWKVTQQFAQAILGKAYLWQKKYDDAAKTFDKIVESGLYKLYADYENILSYNAKQNCESMFESIKVSDAANVWNNFSMLGVMRHWRTDKLELNKDLGIATNGWGFCYPQKNLYDDFVKVEGENGYRLNATMKTYDQFVGMGNSVTGPVYGCEGFFMWKWRVLAAQQPSSGYGMVDDGNTIWMRYAEVLLCAAEAHLMNQNSGKADEYMNMIRTRAQAPAITGATLEDIQLEKRLELCGEGTRFQDMVRWGIAEKRMKEQGKNCPTLLENGNVEYKVYNDSNYGFKPKHNLFPYAGIETRQNPAITQNIGW